MTRLNRDAAEALLEADGGSGAIEPRHGSHGSSERRFRCALLLQRGGNHPGADGLGEQQYVARLRANIAPDALRIDHAGDRIAELDVVIADRIAAKPAPDSLIPFGQ